MAKISNQTAYPAITPVGGDYLVLTDVSDSNKTKTVTVQSLADFIDGQVTLQEVLDASDPGVVPPTAVAIGSITLTGTFASPAGANVNIQTLGTGDDVDITGGSASGSINLGAAQIDGTAAAINLTSTTNDINLRSNTGDILIKAADKTIISANGSSYGAQPAGTAMIYNQNDDIIINASGGLITIGGTYPNRPTGLDLGPIDGDIDIWAFSAGSKINLTANSGIDSLSIHNFAANNGITLDGVAGAAGEVLGSDGPGNPLAWKTVSSLLTLPTSNIFAGDGAGVATATDKIAVDITAGVGPDIRIGKAAPSLTNTLQNGLYYMAGTHPYGDLNLSYGQDSLSQPLIGSSFNTALGLGALEETLTGGENTGVGFRALAGNRGGQFNTAVGSNALSGAVPNSVGDNNTAIGDKALSGVNNILSIENTAVGSGALSASTSAAGNTVVGYNAGRSIVTGEANVCVGRETMDLGGNIANANSFVGDQAGRAVRGAENTGLGWRASNTLTVGNKNVTLGAASDVQTNNTANATAVGYTAVAGSGGTAIGGPSNAGDNCIALGSGSTAATTPAGLEVMNIALWATLTTAAGAHVFPDNGAALAAGLNPGDIYSVDPTAIMGAGGAPLPAIGAGGPAILAIVYP